jgi:hypothetical protein
MAVALAIFGVSFAAFCVWLGVRVINRREWWAKWTAVFVLVVLGYPLSYPGVERLAAELRVPNWAFDVMVSIYTPVFIAIDAAPQGIGTWYFHYQMKFMPDETPCGMSL